MSVTITERAPGVFAIRVRLGPHRETEYFRIRGTRQDAELAAARYTKQVGLRPLAAGPKATLGRWMRYMLDNAHDLSPATLATYRTHLETWIDPRPARRWQIGAMKLRDITEEDAGAFIAWAHDGCGCYSAHVCRHGDGFRKGLRPRTFRESIILIRTALDRAVSRGMLLSNPWEHVRLPRAQRRPPATPGRDDLSRLADCELPRVRLLLMLAAYTGARRGELLALSWELVNLKIGAITIGASLDHQRGGSMPTLKEPKTASGRRTIALPAIVLSELRVARLAANTLAVNTGRRIEQVPVFANDDDGSWWTPDAASQAAARALRELGVPGSLHTLRHAHATLLLSGEAGVSPHIVSRRLGHASVATTLSLYAHAIPADDGAAVTAIDRLFAQPTGQRGNA
jgi:integrase